jgi:hypothetical protein
LRLSRWRERWIYRAWKVDSQLGSECSQLVRNFSGKANAVLPVPRLGLHLNFSGQQNASDTCGRR